jgi:hypothetical protein
MPGNKKAIQIVEAELTVRNHFSSSNNNRNPHVFFAHRKKKRKKYESFGRKLLITRPEEAIAKGWLVTNEVIGAPILNGTKSKVSKPKSTKLPKTYNLETWVPNKRRNA